MCRRLLHSIRGAVPVSVLAVGAVFLPCTDMHQRLTRAFAFFHCSTFSSLARAAGSMSTLRSLNLANNYFSREAIECVLRALALSDVSRREHTLSPAATHTMLTLNPHHLFPGALRASLQRQHSGCSTLTSLWAARHMSTSRFPWRRLSSRLMLFFVTGAQAKKDWCPQSHRLSSLDATPVLGCFSP